ncbi:MAG: hypothetical protein A3A10_00635 [Candidatus Tagabacteria bacterium RIFCSPLOWO2_01_FULL_42_9]|uniref:MotA/TolQ/ExbB proton channel domain-containing protein n=1 Tax=Candidatus Tagabacteria bacterium RIFCSPLOWO2_01_FULL_42_9 TaxID=1802296 RepID=A0A1G2LVY3_9BACT|nr:MAG: hypothetical protein A3A10_00635 [Candidatus Tagabacteria bacterium RIFCSPLOWO2_01_FULL_42_9]
MKIKKEKEKMKILLGIVLILAGIALGIYVGFWLLFVGGIMTIINAIEADPVSATSIAWGAIKIIFAGATGGLSFCALALPGIAFLKSGLK